MKSILTRLCCAALTLSLAAGPLSLPVQAATSLPAIQAQGFFDFLSDIPVLGDLVRLITGADDDTATPETAPTATPETALPTASPTATPETATAETALVGVPAWPTGWMFGAVAAGYRYPAGNLADEVSLLQEPPAASASPAASPSASASAAADPAPLWCSVDVSADSTVLVAWREETNLGDLVADAVGMAAASWLQTDGLPEALRGLPIVSAVNGGALGNLSVAQLSDADTLSSTLADSPLMAVVVTPQKLRDILNVGLLDSTRSSTERTGAFLQVSGMRVIYKTTGGDPQTDSIVLSSLTEPEGSLLISSGEAAQTNVLLVLPNTQPLRDLFGLNPDNGYSDFLENSGLTLCGSVLALTQTCDAETLSIMLARQGSVGRIQPITAQDFDARVSVGTDYAGKMVSCLVDGLPVSGLVDADGFLLLPGLSAGSHSLQMAAGEPFYYLSSVTHIGTADGTIIAIAAVPEACVSLPATAAPTPAAAPAATQSTVTAVGPVETTAPAATVPVITAAPATKAPAVSTRAPVAIEDPSAGIILNQTPAPTLPPTSTPAPTAAPTAAPEQVALQQATAEHASRLPLYLGLAVLGVAAITTVVLLVRRRLGANDRPVHHRNRRI